MLVCFQHTSIGVNSLLVFSRFIQSIPFFKAILGKKTWVVSNNIYKIFFILVRSITNYLLSIVISAFQIRNYRHCFIIIFWIVALDEGAYLATSQFSVNAIKSSTARICVPSQQKFFDIIFTHFWVSIFNFAFKSYASLFQSYVKWFFIINLFFGLR
jgi:hypothetical protein